LERRPRNYPILVCDTTRPRPALIVSLDPPRAFVRIAGADFDQLRDLVPLAQLVEAVVRTALERQAGAA